MSGYQEKHSREDIVSKLKKIFHVAAGVPEEAIDIDSDLVSDLHVDSLDIVGAIMDIEQEFEIVILDEESDELYIFRSFVDIIENKLRKEGRLL